MKLKEVDMLMQTANMSLSCKHELIRQYNNLMMISISDLEGNITYVNDIFCEDTGYSREELIGVNHRILKHEGNDEFLYEHLWSNLNQLKPFYGKIKVKTKQNEERFHFVFILPIMNENKEVSEYICFRERVEKTLYFDFSFSSIYDKLTKLKNEYHFSHELISKSTFAAIIDINKFANINNYFGYEDGNKILIDVAKRLSMYFGEHRVYKFDGDIFCVTKSDTNPKYTLEDFKNYTLKLIDLVFHQAFVINNHDVYLECTVGVAIGSKDNLLGRLKNALKSAKNNLKKSHTYTTEAYSYELKDFKKEVSVIKEVNEALMEDRIVPFFQPIYNNKEKKVTKFECLARIKLKNGEFMQPGEFIGIASKNRLIYEITKVIIRKSCNYFDEYPEYSFSINLTIKVLSSDETMRHIKNIISTMINPQRIVFEIVENEQIEEDIFIKNKHIQDLKKYGCKFALDDFGNGYSNLATFVGFGYEYVKIDGSLVKILNTEKGKRLIETIVAVSKQINVEVIAEWISDEEVFHEIRKMGVDYSQGYYIGKPSTVINQTFQF